VDVKGWNRKYAEAINHVKLIIRNIQGIITAFNVNIDALHFVKNEEIEKKLAVPEVLKETLQNLKSLPFKIETPSEFLAGLIFTMKTGHGCEWIIHKREVFEWILTNFSIDELRMGGQAGIVTNVLASLNVPNIYPHASQLPEMQAKLFVDKENIKIPMIEKGIIAFRKPLMAVRSSDEPLIHWIFEFDKGTEVKINDERIETPAANRFIATWDEYNARLELDPAFEEGSLRIIKNADKAMISGYHLLRKKYPGGSTFNECIEKTVKLLSRWKKVNPHLKIHFEQAFLSDLEIIKATCDEVFPYVDALGLNEDEVALILDAYGWNELAEKIRSECSAFILYEGAEKILGMFKLRRIIIHTRDFVLSLLKPEYEITPETEQHALLFGAAVAATRATTGQFGSLDDVQETLANPVLHLSEVGLTQHLYLAEKLEQIGITASERFLKTGIAKSDEYSLIYIPTKITDHPVSTVGLGDCITAGILVGENE